MGNHCVFRGEERKKLLRQLHEVMVLMEIFSPGRFAELVSMPDSLVKCSPEQLRLRTSEEREADRFLVRDLRAAAASLHPEVGFSPNVQKNFTDLTGEERLPGDLSTPGLQQMPECRVSQPAGEMPQSAEPVAASAPMSQANGSSNQSSLSLGEAISQMSSQERQQWVTSAERADRLDGLPVRPHPTGSQQGDPKRPRLEEVGVHLKYWDNLNYLWVSHFPHLCQLPHVLRVFPLLWWHR